MERRDVLDELREAMRLRPVIADMNVNVLELDVPVKYRVLDAAIREIERLRQLAGVVSEGKSFAQIKKKAHPGRGVHEGETY